MRRSTRDAGVQPGVGEWRLAVAGRRRLGSPGAAGDAPWTAGVPGCGQQKCGWVAGPRQTTSWSWSAATRPLRSTGGRPGPESGALHAASARRAARVDDEKVERGAARTLRRQGRVRIRAPTRTARTVRPRGGEDCNLVGHQAARSLPTALELSFVLCRMDVYFICLAASKQRFVLRAVLSDAACPLGRDVCWH